MSMSEEAKRVRYEYMKKYREDNKKRLREYDRQWRSENPDKVRASQNRFWERKAQETIS